MWPLSLALLAALCSVAVGQDKLYITADNSLKEVCVNGKNLPLMEQANTASRLDRMPMPANWNAGSQGCITVSAHNSNPRTWGGVLACVKSSVLVNLYWQCVQLPELNGASCCGSCMNPIWDLPSSSNIIQMGPNQGHKKDFVSKLPSQCKASTNWVWDNHRLQPNVCCRSAPCAGLCNGCDTAGPGKCDPGKCVFSATGAPAPYAFCSAKCYVKAEIFPTTQTGPAYYGKAEITNPVTGDVYHVPVTNSQFAFMIDIATCRPIIDGGVVFMYGTETVAGTGTHMTLWSSAPYVAWTGSYIVDMTSGAGSKWLGVQQSDGNGAPQPTPLYIANLRSVSFTISGYTFSIPSQVMSDIKSTSF